jgi:peptidoglycan/LPS O-acetylase OafA/YrhL
VAGCRPGAPFLVLRGWSGITPGTAVFWSLAVEEHFYLLFPLLYVTIRKTGLGGRGQAAVFWSLCAVVLAWRCYLVLVTHSSVERTYLCSDTRIDSILFGCALAVRGNPMIDRRAGPSHRGLWLYLALPVTSFSRGVRCLTALGISVAASWAMWVVVEEPCARLRRRIAGRASGGAPTSLGEAAAL